MVTSSLSIFHSSTDKDIYGKKVDGYTVKKKEILEGG
jgi:hypothetical protein